MKCAAGDILAFWSLTALITTKIARTGILKDEDKTHGLCVITHRANWAIITMVLSRLKNMAPGLGLEAFAKKFSH